MGTDITLTSDDGFEFAAYIAEPEGAARGGIVVVQEIFGVNAHIRDVTDRYAAAGYLAIAPAVFDRVERGVDLDYTSEGMQAGIAIARGGGLDFAKVLADVRAAGKHVGSAGKVGIVGYCFGGSVTAAACIQAADVFSAGSGYYGSNVVNMIGQQPVVPLQLHFGELDHGIPMSDVQKITEAWTNTDVYVYQAEHGFHCDQRASFNAASAGIAQARTFRHFAQHVG